MAFTCVATQPPAQNINIVNNAGRWDVIFQIGFDPSGPYTYYQSIHTYPSQGSLEFAFCLVIVDNASRRHAFTYRSSEVRQIIPRSCRTLVDNLLWYYSRELLIISKPSGFFMETFELNLPNAALVKYDVLCHVFKSLGYSVTPTPTTTGKLKWVMT